MSRFTVRSQDRPSPPERIVRIPLDCLRPGMFVSSLDISWFKHPYLSSKLGLNHNATVIRELEQLGVCHVYIDASRGLDGNTMPPPGVLPPNFQGTGVRPVAAPPDTSPEHAGDREPEERPYSPLIPLPEDGPESLRFAKGLFTQAVACTKKILCAVENGQPLDLAEAKGLVRKLAATVNANGTVVQLLSVLKAYDDYTYTHCLNVAALGVLMGKHLNLTHAEVETLGLAGLLHDVGKCLLPKALINKPGALDDHEFQTIKSHPMLGYQYLMNLTGVPQPVVRAVLEHHERQDGSGYPNGLKDASIGRISSMLGVLDVFDALTSDRVYRERMSPHLALKTLYESRGKHFSKPMLERFIQCVGIYPPDSVVQLRNGLYAVVTKQNRVRPLFPEVMVFGNRHTQPIARKRVDTDRLCREMASSGYEIVRCVEPSELPAPAVAEWI